MQEGITHAVPKRCWFTRDKLDSAAGHMTPSRLQAGGVGVGVADIDIAITKLIQQSVHALLHGLCI